MRILQQDANPHKAIRPYPGAFVGVLALTNLRDAPAFQQTSSSGSPDISPTRLEPGDMMWYDGDNTCVWQSPAKGYAVIVRVPKKGTASP